MPNVKLNTVIDGDVLASNLYVDDVYLFGTGTVLTKKRIEILKNLKVKSVVIETRYKKYGSREEIFDNIDKRFSYVENIPVMEHIKTWVKDIIANTGANRNETSH